MFIPLSAEESEKFASLANSGNIQAQQLYKNFEIQIAKIAKDQRLDLVGPTTSTFVKQVREMIESQNQQIDRS